MKLTKKPSQVSKNHNNNSNFLYPSQKNYAKLATANNAHFQGRTIFVCPPLGRTDKICPPLGRTNKLWSLGTFPTFQVPFFQVYFIYFPIFQVEFINFPLFRTLSNDFPILGIKCLYFPPETVISYIFPS